MLLATTKHDNVFSGTGLAVSV